MAVRFAGAAPDYSELASLPGVSQVDGVDLSFRLYTRSFGQVATELVRLVDRNGLVIRDISSCKPSLEEVFLHFTSGRRKRDQ